MNSSPLYATAAESSENQAGIFLRNLRQQQLTPFTGADSSAGMEYEVQVAVLGDSEHVDLPQSLKNSSFFTNTEKRAARGDLPERSLAALQSYLSQNDSGVWENSWVRLDPAHLSEYARRIFATDLLADKSQPEGPQRADRHRFFINQHGRELIRIPVSYLLKLSLADLLAEDDLPPALRATGGRLLGHYLSDNTSPEILSFTIQQASDGPIGQLAAAESARVLLFTQLLVQYANSKFGLTASGQTCLLYNAPHAPLRQKLLNELVPDGYYRHLFMSPCLSGWQRGEDKHRYMQLCHSTLSRSQLNAIAKLKDAGIITNNLVILPNTSNTCLANNGTHVSLGSRLLTRAAEGPLFSSGVEKYLGDLAIKIIEHFLPLLVGTCSAAPYRLDFVDFHPEKVLGFLPHELDFTHLRMLWRRWRKKADIRFLGQSFTPFGPRQLDRMIATLFGLHGDLVPDFRLLDYLVTLLSTENCPALDGSEGNHQRLKEELTDLGVFDHRMSMYLPYRQRLHAQLGFSGFEGRSHSLFPSLLGDMAVAIDLQNLLTSVAYKLMINGRVRHADIPDHPFIESERRQIFFAAAIGLPTVFIKADTANRFLRKILGHVHHQRHSRRYKGFIRVPLASYQLALLEMLAEEGKGLMEAAQLKSLLGDLRERLTSPAMSACGRLLDGIRDSAGFRRPVRRIAADAFNQATEQYYRQQLRTQHLQEGFSVLQDDCRQRDQQADPLWRQLLAGFHGPDSTRDRIEQCRTRVLSGSLPLPELRQLVLLCLAIISGNHNRHGATA